MAERAISTPPSLVRSYSPDERAELAAGTTEDWSREAWAASRDVAYAEAQGGNPCGPKPTARVTLNDASIARSVDPQRLQVTRAGLRLARLLDEAFDPARGFDSRIQRER